MERITRRVAMGAAAVAIALTTAGAAGADLTGPYDGQLVVGRAGQTLAASGALTQSGRTVSGTLVFSASDPALSGAYVVSGTAGPRRFKLSGANGGGARLAWHGVVGASGVAGTATLRGPSGRLKGRLSLTRQVAPSNGASCDAIFTQNETFFTSQVMDQVLLATCVTCHVPGGQAQATRLQVMRGDPLGTARSVALVVDTANPPASLLLRKPTAAVPHGGGQQIAPGSSQEQILRQWVDFLVSGQCSAGGGATPAGNLFSQSCAGCHGADGSGGTGPDVRCTVRSQVAAAVRSGRGQAMPAMALSSADLTTISSFLHGNCSGLPRDIYAANCASCHGPTAGGGRNAAGQFGPNIRCSEGGDFGGAVRGGTEGMPAFAELTGAQVAGLARYVGSFCGLGGGGGGGD